LVQEADDAHDEVRANKTLRTYTYLNTALNTKSDVRDVLDCLTPFILSIAAKDPSRPLYIPDIIIGLEEIGLQIPYYAIEQLLPRLQSDGLLEWSPALKAHLITKKAEEASRQRIELSQSFVSLEAAMKRFAEARGRPEPTVSSTWSDALIRFLKDNYDGVQVKVVDVKGSMVGETGDIESFTVARFIQSAQVGNPGLFDEIVQIYCGVLIEEFISNIQSIGQDQNYEGLSVFYDTSVLLRMLGTSGNLLRDATLEMHHTLQSLGAKTYYLPRTQTEVENILDTLSVQYARGNEIFGETADAITSGEITIGRIRELATSCAAELARVNIFVFEYEFSTRRGEDHFQIDERQFTELLKEGARRNDRGYSLENALNDSEAVAIILRLRRGRASRKIGDSKYVFVSKNTLLQRTARKYAVEHTEYYDNSSVPPVLTTGQATTAAWLAEAKSLEPKKVTKELLASCYAAVQPDREWAEEFGKQLERIRADNPDLMLKVANASLVLQNIRNIARDETLNESSALRKINLAEFLRQETEKANREFEETQLRAAEREAALIADVEARASLSEADIRRAHSEELATAVQQASASALQKAEAERHERYERKAKRVVKVLLRLTQALFVVALVVALVITGFFEELVSKEVRMISVTTVIVVTILSALDLIGIPVVRKYSDKVTEKMAGSIAAALTRL
jgi:hypothetical protein